MNPYGLVVRQIVGRMRSLEDRFTLVSERFVLAEQAFVFDESEPLTVAEVLKALGDHGLQRPEAGRLIMEARAAFAKWLTRRS